MQERLQHLPCKRTAAILGDCGDPAACVAGLHAVGFQRIVATACEPNVDQVQVVQDLSQVPFMVMGFLNVISHGDFRLISTCLSWVVPVLFFFFFFF